MNTTDTQPIHAAPLDYPGPAPHLPLPERGRWCWASRDMAVSSGEGTQGKRNVQGW